MGISDSIATALWARLLLAFIFPIPITSLPLRLRSVVSIDPSPDAWAETLSGIGPLILLVGERATKQLLRAVRGLSDAFNLASAPLGLLSVATSLTRLCGYQRLRSFIGYELEARAVAAVDMTRANCGGIHAEVIDGYVSRSTASRPASQAIGVSLLRSTMLEGKAEALAQIGSCEEFEGKKRRLGIPDDVAAACWALHIVSPRAQEDVSSVVAMLYQAVSSGQPSVGRVQRFCNSIHEGWGTSPERGENAHLEQESITKINDKMSSPLESPERKNMKESATSVTVNTVLGRETTQDQIRRVEHAATFSTGQFSREKTGLTAISTASAVHGRPSQDEPSPGLTFMFTLDSVSEYTTSPSVPKLGSILLGTVSMAAILAVYLLSLWRDGWSADAGLILVIAGYFGIVFSVVSAALTIQSSCVCMPLRTRSSVRPSAWEDGLVISVKNTDSMDTSGSDFMQSRFGPQSFEMVYLRKLSRGRKAVACLTVATLVFFFLCHYLGLRSSRWWVSMGELLICILAAVARSTTKGRQARFDVVDGVKIDKRCTSTGIITVQESQKVERESCSENTLDARAYSVMKWRAAGRPSNGESIAWHAATRCFQDQRTTARILAVTGMHADIVRGANDHVAVVAHYRGGLVVTEGLASPSTHVCLAFRSAVSDLARPTALLARGIMRQPKWALDRPGFGADIPLGNVYILNINSVMTWWSLSEDRNDAEDLQSNLQWCFALLNVAFFLELLRLRAEGWDMRDVEEAHSGQGDSDRGVAEGLARFLIAELGSET